MGAGSSSVGSSIGLRSNPSGSASIIRQTVTKYFEVYQELVDSEPATAKEEFNGRAI